VQEVLTNAVMLVSVVGVLALGTWLAFASDRQIRAAWAAFAAARGLSHSSTPFVPSSLRIFGRYRDLDVEIRAVTRGSGKSRSTWMVCRVLLSRPLPAGLRVTTEGFFSRVGQLILGADVQTGDPEVDRRLHIQASDAAEAKAFLHTPRVRRALYDLAEAYSGMEVKERSVTVETRGLMSSERALAALLNRVVAAAIGLQAPLSVEQHDIFHTEALLSREPQREPTWAMADVQQPPEERMLELLASGGGVVLDLRDDVEEPALDPPLRATELPPMSAAAEPAQSTPAPPHEPPALTLDKLLGRLSDSGLTPRQREALGASFVGTRLQGRLRVDRVTRTFGFRLPEHLRDGMTLEGSAPESRIRLIVRFSAARTPEVERLLPGQEAELDAVWVGWEEIGARATLDAR
jgi:hypothetical protein